MSYCHMYGIFGFKKNLHKARNTLQKAVDSGYCLSVDYLNLGVLYEDVPGNPEPSDRLKAFNLYKTGAEMGDSTAQFNAAEVYRCGIPGRVGEDLAEAEKYYKLSAGEERSDPVIGSNLLHTFQRELLKSVESACKLMTPLQSRFRLWEMYSTHENQYGKPQPVEAVKHLQIAAEEGYTDAEREYGKLFLEGGFGFKENHHMAKVWLLKAASKDEKESISLLKTISLMEQSQETASSTKMPKTCQTVDKIHGKDVQLATHKVTRSSRNSQFEPLEHLLQDKPSIRNPYKTGSAEHIKFEQMMDFSKHVAPLSGSETFRLKNPTYFHESMLLQHQHSPTAKRYLKALKCFNEGLDLLTNNPNSQEKVEGIHALARAYLIEKHVCRSPILTVMFDKFLKVATDAVSINGKDYACRYFLVTSLLMLKDVTDTQQIIDRELLIKEMEDGNEDSPFCRQILYKLNYELGSFYSVTHQYDRAVYCSQKAYERRDVKVMDIDNDALRAIAFNMFRLGDTKSAIEHFKKYLETTPRCERRYPSAHFHLAVIYTSLHSLQRTFYHYEQGLRAEADRLPFHDPEDMKEKKLIKLGYDNLCTKVCNNPECQTPDDKDIKQCPCKLVYYCSKSCQKVHRPIHKKVCTVKKAKP